MDTKRIWQRQGEERRWTNRVAANFYAVEVEGQGRYLRRVANVSDDGLLLESPLGDEQPGRTIELELPTNDNGVDTGSLRVQGEVVYVHPDGRVGVHVSEPLPVDSLGGRLPL